MQDLWFYERLSRLTFLNYRAKIMVTAFIGTHVPLIVLASYFALQSSPDWMTFFTTVGITLVATLVGTGLTLFVLNELMRPVFNTSRTLRNYRLRRQPSDLPNHFKDEVGTLMADAGDTIAHLESVRDLLEHVDADTGLANRQGLVRDITRQAAGIEVFSLVVMRFTNLDRIAEACDAREANAALKIVADRFRDAVPKGSVLARPGQTDLAVLLLDQTAISLADAVAAILAASSGDIALRGLVLKPDLVCGVASYPSDARDATALLDHASAAAAMATPAQPTMYHSPEARARSMERLRLEQELRGALKRGEFRAHYQPIVNLREGRVCGAEALIRWQHPDRGMVMPGQFIPVAERSGLIDSMGLWIMREACDQVSRWTQEGRTGLSVAVNLSARQFLDPDLKRHVAEAIEAAGIQPWQLEIELTETAAMADYGRTHRVFTILRDLGVGIAIDDFGTGYASLSYLRKLPFDKLKIDREFVTDVYKKSDSQAICGALVALSRGLGLKVLAEGTETEEEVRFLSGLGCDLFQGYVFAKPLPAPQFMITSDALTLRSAIRRMATPQQPASVAAAS